MSILLIHVLLTTLHVLSLTSSATTIPRAAGAPSGELLALSQNRQPASTVLQAAEHRGRDRPLEHIAQIANIRVRQTLGLMADHGDEHAHAQQHVELVFGESPQALIRDMQGVLSA
ncbi:uncharacterized protein LDX57_006016 [Aspergillus melleus]|uniref:uncharacterized protein n=1 Tax=Aspergillus melleus TaxID=138277 RepID=UPI001E8CD30B|nr:uncharacterized protein LDX57_006016 [Aspergillus melleus]KAH8428315.1 hypothetical protein LDX57_006016 [Aspergillus melleus]